MKFLFKFYLGRVSASKYLYKFYTFIPLTIGKKFL